MPRGPALTVALSVVTVLAATPAATAADLPARVWPAHSSDSGRADASTSRPLATPPQPRRSGGRLQPLTLRRDLKDALDRELSGHEGIGASAAVMMPGRRPWTGTSGTTNGHDEIEPEMLFGVASITKTYTATVVMLLVEDGVLGLDDAVSSWLPPLPNINGSATVRQLLDHTSGIFDYAEHPGYIPAVAADPTRRWTPEETVEAFVLSPYADPGATFHYSNTGYLLLGMIIERATGSDLAAVIRHLILDPLELDRTFFAVDETVEGIVAHPWADLDANGTLEDIAYVPRTALESTGWSAGALYATAEDVAGFLRALTGGEVMLQSSLDEMLDFRSVAPGFGYGLGVQEVAGFVSGLSCIGHDGGTLGYTSRVISIADAGVTIAVLLNHSSGSTVDDAETLDAISRALASVALSQL